MVFVEVKQRKNEVASFFPLVFEAVLHRNSAYKVTLLTNYFPFFAKIFSTFGGIGEATRERGCFKSSKIEIASD